MIEARAVYEKALAEANAIHGNALDKAISIRDKAGFEAWGEFSTPDNTGARAVRGKATRAAWDNAWEEARDVFFKTMAEVDNIYEKAEAEARTVYEKAKEVERRAASYLAWTKAEKNKGR